MNELVLSRDQRLILKAQAHHLEPVVLLGAHGLTDAVVKEIDRALNAHALIKVRVPGSERAQLEQIFQQVAERLGAARVQLIGRLMVLFRPLPPAQTAAPEKPQRPRSGTSRTPARAQSPRQPASGRSATQSPRQPASGRATAQSSRRPASGRATGQMPRQKASGWTATQSPRPKTSDRSGFGAARAPARRATAGNGAAKPARAARASQRPLKRT